MHSFSTYYRSGLRNFPILLAVSMLFGAMLPSTSVAQLVRNHTDDGGLRSFHANAPRRITRSFEADSEAKSELLRILGALGLSSIADRIILRASAETANAEAVVGKNGERFVFYNAAFMQKVKERSADHWSLVSILAHEIGHHLAFHTELEGRHHEFELEADYFSGFVLRRLGATLDQSQAAMRSIGAPEPSPTHPGLDQRLQAITVGWTDGGTGDAPKGLKSTSNPTAAASDTAGRSPMPQVSASAPAPRTALVIGNSAYVHLPPIKNTATDAAIVGKELEKRGFRVMRGLDVDAKTMMQLVTEFENVLSIVGGTGLFYYGGHSVYIDGEDIMFPVDTKVNDKQGAIIGGLNLSRLIKEIKSRTTAPLKENGNAAIYSASKGEVAADGFGDKSPFTEAFLEAIRAEDDELSDTFRRIKSTIAKPLAALRHKQTPFYESSLDHRFYLTQPDKDPRTGVTRILIFDSCRDNPFKLDVR